MSATYQHAGLPMAVHGKRLLRGIGCLAICWMALWFAMPAMAQLTGTANASPVAGTAPLTVSFTASASGGVPPYTFLWSFGDTSTSTLQNPTHIYTSPGNYQPTVTITDSTSPTPLTFIAATQPIEVFAVATIIATPTCGTVDLNVCFSATMPGTGPFSYQWNFGDGSFPTPNVNDPLPCHVFQTPNSLFTVSVLMVDIYGVVGFGTIFISTDPLTVTPCVTPVNGPAPLVVQFNDGCGTPPSGGIPPYSLDWDYGDGSQHCYDWASQHAYNLPGIYHVTLVVKDSCHPQSIVTDTHIIITVAPGALAAAATSDRTCGPAPTTVCFSGSAAGGTAPYTYSWDFGDGGAPVLGQSPCHAYTTPGSYTVTLTVTDSLSATSVDSHIIEQVTAPLSVTASANKTSGFAPLTVSFLSSITGGTGPYTYSWNFGDGQTSIEGNPVHVYSQPGYYAVSVTVTDGCTPAATATDSHLIISVGPVLASATSNVTCGVAPLNVYFTGTASGGAPPYTWAWTFGDGGTSNEQNPTHSYLVAGTYTAKLTVTDNAGLVGTSSVIVGVTKALAVSIAGLPLTTGSAPLTVNLSSTVTDGTPPYTYAWDFGDGSPKGTASTEQHTWTAPGVYHVVLAVTDSCGGSQTATLLITAYGGLTATAVADPNCGYVPVNVNFTGTASGGVPPYSYAWNFGDGSAVDTHKDPSHGYSVVGNYTVHLVVKDSAGNTSAPAAIMVSVTTVMLVGCNATPLTGNAFLTVNFTSSVTGGSAPYTYTWDFGDGSPVLPGPPAPKHVYNATGTFTVTLTVTDSCSHSVVDDHLSITVTNPITMSITATPAAGPAPLSVGFTAAIAGALAPYAYDWDFGDGSVHSQDAAPTHTYAAGGAYTAKLTLEDSLGIHQVATTTVNVYFPVIGAPTVNQACGYAPLNVIFHANPSGGVPPYTFTWTFGDGGSDTLENPSHSYLAVGTYVATVTVKDSKGTVGSGTVTVSVTPPMAVIVQGLPVTIGPAPLTVNVSSTVTGGTPPYTYDWDFKDGSQHSTSPADQHTWIDPGDYDVVLAVKDACGHEVDAHLAISVYGPVTPTITASVACGTIPLNVCFTPATTGGVPPYTYSWNFGDGTALSKDMLPCHYFLSAGTYQVVLTATDSLGHQGSSAPFAIQAVAPIVLGVSASASGSLGLAPFSVIFTANLSGSPGPFTYDWDFGDGSTHDTGSSPTHIYATSGTYQVVLTVTVADACGRIYTAQDASLSIKVVDAPYIQITSPADGGVYHGSLVLQSLVLDDVPVLEVDYDIGGFAGSATAPPYTVTLDTSGLNGSYTVTATVYDNAGRSSTSDPVTFTLSNPTLNGEVIARSGPFRLQVFGTGFLPGCKVYINGTPAPATIYKSPTMVVVKGGAALKAMVPSGVPVVITLSNPDRGASGSATFVR